MRAGRTEFSGSVAAVVPARNEAELIGPVVTSLLNQSVAMTVFLVDDESTDCTAELAVRAAEEAGKTDALVVVQSKPLPKEWTGKLWAMHQGIEQARTRNPAWLLLTDADVVHDPHTVANLGSIASQGNYDLVSFMVKLHCESFAEKLLIPAFVYFFFMLYPPAWIRDSRRSTAGAAGGCMLVRSKALECAGGLSAIPGEVIDDCSLARLLKQQGGRLWLGITDQSESLRRYKTFSEIERMVSRTAFNQLKHSSLLLLCTVAAMTITYLAPPLLLFTGSMAAMLIGHRGLDDHGYDVLEHGALLSAEPRMGTVPAASGAFLYGRDNTFSNEILERWRRRVEREGSGCSEPPRYLNPSASDLQIARSAIASSQQAPTQFTQSSLRRPRSRRHKKPRLGPE